VTPTFPLGLALGWARVVCVFVVDVGLLAAGTAVGGRPGWWVGAGAGVLVTLGAVVSWRGAPALTLTWQSLRPRRASLGVPAGALADHDRTFGAGPVGIRVVGPHLVAVVAVDGQPHSPSALDYPRVMTPSMLPLAAVAAGLRQFDVTLDGIDVVSVGVRRASKAHHPYADTYSSEVGDHPAVGQRQTWLVIRLNAAESARAIVWRESVAATMSAAAEWLAQELTSLRIPARVLTAAQIRAADEALLAGAEPAALRPGWARVRHSGGYVHTYWMSPRDISSDTLDRLWTPDTEATVLTVQLRLTATGASTVGVVVRYHTGAPLLEAPLTGLNPLTGRHDAGMTAGLLVAAGAPLVPARELSADDRVAVAIGATGIIMGTTASGHPLLIDIGNPTGMATVTVAGELALTVQIALRAAATGYQVLVCTARPERWKEATGAGLQVVGEAGLAQQLAPARRRWMVVYDEVSGPVPQGAAVTLRTVEAGLAIPADVHIEQDGPKSAVIRTWAIQSRLGIDIEHERRLSGGGPGLAA
jgi:type VII secretion protein EccE